MEYGFIFFFTDGVAFQTIFYNMFITSIVFKMKYVPVFENILHKICNKTRFCLVIKKIVL